MARAVVPVYTPTFAGQTPAPQTLDSTNKHLINGFNAQTQIHVANSAGSTITVTLKGVACPTCSVSTDKVITVAANGENVISGVNPNLYKQADGSLWIDPSANTGSIYALQP